MGSSGDGSPMMLLHRGKGGVPLKALWGVFTGEFDQVNEIALFHRFRIFFPFTLRSVKSFGWMISGDCSLALDGDLILFQRYLSAHPTHPDRERQSGCDEDLSNDPRPSSAIFF